jgi:hypothetical protein
MLKFKPEGPEPEESSIEAIEAKRLLDEATKNLSEWARKYLSEYKAESDGQETEVSLDFLTLIESFRTAIKTAENLNVDVSHERIILRLIDEQRTLRDKAVTLAGLEF